MLWRYLPALLLLTACSKDPVRSSDKPDTVPPDPVEYTYQIPEPLDDGWETASLAVVGVDSLPLIRMMNGLLNSRNHGIHSILIVKNGKLVFEAYFPGQDLYGPPKTFGPTVPHCLCSVTKSVTSVLLGIALDRGLIQSLDEKIFSFLPDYSSLKNESNDAITIKHLISMTSGFEWDENSVPFTDPRNDLINFNQSSDPIGYLLRKPVIHIPGTVFNYNGGNINLAGEIIRRASGKRLEVFSEELFTPLCIEDFEWIILPASRLTYASGDLHLRPRDMAKIGLMYLNHGVWNDREIVSSQWIDESSRPQANGFPYGYGWWIRRWYLDSHEYFDGYHAGGWGGQFIFIIEELDMVAVFTGGNFATNGDTPVFSRMQGYILPAVFRSVKMR